MNQRIHLKTQIIHFNEQQMEIQNRNINNLFMIFTFSVHQYQFYVPLNGHLNSLHFIPIVSEVVQFIV